MNTRPPPCPFGAENDDAMSLQFHCPYCNTLLSTSAERSGTIVSCGRCHRQLRVPEPVAPETTPHLVEVEVQTTKPALVDGFKIIDDEPQTEARIPPPTTEIERLIPSNSHRPWYRDPVVVFGWLLPLYLLAGFVVWAAMNLKRRRCRCRRANDAATNNELKPPWSESTDEKKTEPHPVENPRRRRSSPQKPSVPVVAGFGRR